jgi:uncharacterized coiled-coil DUF342 family protein
MKIEIDQLKAELLHIAKKIAEADELLREPRARLRNIKQQLRESCPDDCENCQVKQDYTPGGYLDKGYTTKYRECKVCEKYKEIKRVSTGNYG